MTSSADRATALPRVALGSALILLGALPMVANDYHLFLVGLVACYALSGLGLTILTGWGGQISLAHAGFMGAGAYIAAILIGEGVPWPAGLAAAALACGVLGVIVGLPAVRLRGLYLAVATLAFGELVVVALIEARDVTGGVTGLTVSSISVFGIRSTASSYYLAVGTSLVAIGAVVALRRSAFARRLKAVRDVEVATGALAMSATRIKLTGFATSAVLAGLAGALYAHLLGFISPRVFGVALMVQLLVMVFVGGVNWVSGAVVGAVLVVALRQGLQDTGSLQTVLFGALLMLTIALLPTGVVTAPRALSALHRRRRGARPVVAAGVASVASTSVDITRNRPVTPLAPRSPTRTMTVDSVKVAFGGNVALKDVSLDFRAGFQGLIGPNGAGKTTLFNAVTGYVRPVSGRICLGDSDITGWAPRRIAAAGVARTFQTPKLVGELTVRENALLGLDGRRAQVGRDGDLDRLLKTFNLRTVQDTPAEELPLALMKVVELVRALAGNPRVLLLDEPVAGLTAEEIDDLVGPLGEHVSDTDCTVVVVEHDLELIRRICSHTAVLNFGECLAEGDPASVLERPEVLSAYLGGDRAAVDS